MNDPMNNEFDDDAWERLAAIRAYHRTEYSSCRHIVLNDAYICEYVSARGNMCGAMLLQEKDGTWKHA